MAAKCPNCGEKVARTEDWACQLCAYPLMSGSFKVIPKTYKQLKEEERAARLPSLPEEPVAVIEPEPAPEPQPEPEPQAKPKAKAKPRAKPKAGSETKTRKPKRVTRRKPAAKAEAAPEPEALSEPEPVAVPEDEPLIESDVEPGQAELELTAEELLAAYEANGAEAGAEYSAKVLKLTGVVSRIEVREMMGIQYITLASAEKERMQNIRCIFGQKHAAALNALTLGQAVTVLGHYDGSLIDINLRNCLLV